MESSSGSQKLNFEVLHSRLVRLVRSRVDNGEFTERGLARLTGISQPQVHNVLKGFRRLSPDIADIFLEKLDLSILDLLSFSDPAEHETIRSSGRGDRHRHTAAASAVLQIPLNLFPVNRKAAGRNLVPGFRHKEQAS